MKAVYIVKYIVFIMGSLFFVIGAPLMVDAESAAVDDIKAVCSANPGSSLCSTYNDGGTNNTSDNPVIKVIGLAVNILSYIAGIIAVIYVIWSAFKIVNSRGDSQGVAEGRKTLIFSLVGIFIVIIANQLVLYILSKVQ